MMWRNSLLIGALVAGVAILVLMYVRRGLSDLQGQIDDIETVLAAMPPALTSGQFSMANAFVGQGGGAGAAELGGQLPTGTVVPTGQELGAISQPGYAQSEQEEEEEEMEYDSALLSTAHPDSIFPPAPEYSLDDTNLGVASLVEPGIYQSGVVELTVLTDDGGNAGNATSRLTVEEVDEESDPVDAPTDGSDNEDAEDAPGSAVGAILEAAATLDLAAQPATTPLAEVGEVAAAGDEPRPGDEFDILTLPELKARLKATQPLVKAIGRMKRAEVLDRLRSNPEVEDADDN